MLGSKVITQNKVWKGNSSRRSFGTTQKLSCLTWQTELFIYRDGVKKNPTKRTTYLEADFAFVVLKFVAF